MTRVPPETNPWNLLLCGARVWICVYHRKDSADDATGSPSAAVKPYRIGKIDARRILLPRTLTFSAFPTSFFSGWRPVEQTPLLRSG